MDYHYERQPFGMAATGVVLAQNIDEALRVAAKEYPNATVTVWSIGEYKPGAYRRKDIQGRVVVCG